MNRETLERRVELGIMVLLVGTLTVIFALSYDPDHRKIVDEYLYGKSSSSTVTEEISSDAESLFEERNPLDTSEKTDNTLESYNYAASSEPAPNPPMNAETSVNEAPQVNTSQTGLININFADLNQLQQLDGIGKVKAQAIIDYRETYGAFRTVDELVNVDGIGEKTLEKNRDRITV